MLSDKFWWKSKLLLSLIRMYEDIGYEFEVPSLFKGSTEEAGQEEDRVLEEEVTDLTRTEGNIPATGVVELDFGMIGRHEDVEIVKSTSLGKLEPDTTLKCATDLTNGPAPNADEFSMNVADYQLGEPIGYGSSAIVNMATYLPNGKAVAIKIIDLDRFERNQIDTLRREIQVMTLCRHVNLLSILTSFVHESQLWIVTPFLGGGSCLDLLRCGEFRGGILDEVAIATILLQALQGLEYLHGNGHIHRDVKAGNLLIDLDGQVELADFGVSSSLLDCGREGGGGVRKTFVGTPCWMAPEVMEMTRGYDSKADIWSFGITAYELACGSAPFAKLPPMKVECF